MIKSKTDIVDRVTIRYANETDISDIARVLVDTWHTTFQGLIASSFLDNLNYSQQEVRHRKTLEAGNVLYYVATNQDGTVVGFANAGPDRTIEQPCDAELYAIYIRKESQGNGIGRMLVHAVATELANQNKKSLRVWALTNNPFRHFYVRLGAYSECIKPIQLGSEEYEQESFMWKDLSLLTT